MLGFLKKNPPVSENHLFLVNLHIGRGTNPDMPEGSTGAYVPGFVAAKDVESAAMALVSNLRGKGFEFIGISDGKVHQLDPLNWSSFIQESWPEFTNHFPSQEEVIAGLSSGITFFGPYACYGAQ